MGKRTVVWGRKTCRLQCTLARLLKLVSYVKTFIENENKQRGKFNKIAWPAVLIEY